MGNLINAVLAGLDLRNQKDRLELDRKRVEEEVKLIRAQILREESLTQEREKAADAKTQAERRAAALQRQEQIAQLEKAPLHQVDVQSANVPFRQESGRDLIPQSLAPLLPFQERSFNLGLVAGGETEEEFGRLASGVARENAGLVRINQARIAQERKFQEQLQKLGVGEKREQQEFESGLKQKETFDKALKNFELNEKLEKRKAQNNLKRDKEKIDAELHARKALEIFKQNTENTPEGQATINTLVENIASGNLDLLKLDGKLRLKVISGLNARGFKLLDKEKVEKVVTGAIGASTVIQDIREATDSLRTSGIGAFGQNFFSENKVENIFENFIERGILDTVGASRASDVLKRFDSALVEISRALGGDARVSNQEQVFLRNAIVPDFTITGSELTKRLNRFDEIMGNIIFRSLPLGIPEEQIKLIVPEEMQDQVIRAKRSKVKRDGTVPLTVDDLSPSPSSGSASESKTGQSFQDLLNKVRNANPL